MRSLEPPPGLPLSFTFDPLRVGVKGVPVTAVNIPVTSQPRRTEAKTLGPDGEGRDQIPLTTKLWVWLSADKPRSALVPQSWELVPSVGYAVFEEPAVASSMLLDQVYETWNW